MQVGAGYYWASTAAQLRLGRLLKILRLALATTAVFATLALLQSLQILYFADQNQPLPRQVAEAGFLRYELLLAATLAGTWALLAFFLAQCYENLPRLRLAGWTLSSGALILGSLLPILNLFVLARGVLELWRASASDLETTNPFAWKQRREPELLPLLWLLATIAAELTAGGFVLPAFLGAPPEGTFVPLLVSLSALLWITLTAFLSGQLAARQETRYAAILRKRQAAAPPLGTSIAAKSLEPDQALAVLGISILTWFALDFLFSAFLGSLGPLISLAVAQLAFLVAGFAFAHLQRTPMRRLVPLGSHDPEHVAQAALLGACIPLMTLPLATHLNGWLGLSLRAIAPARIALPVALLTVLAVFVAPVVEEIIFRGIVFDGFETAFGPLKTLLLTAVLFGVAHLHPTQSVIAAFIGLACGLVRLRTGGVIAPMALHLGNNLLVFILSAHESFRRIPVVVSLVVAVGLFAVLSSYALPFFRDASNPPANWLRRSALHYGIPVEHNSRLRDVLFAVAVRTRWLSLLSAVAAGTAILKAIQIALELDGQDLLPAARFLLACHLGILSLLILFRKQLWIAIFTVPVAVAAILTSSYSASWPVATSLVVLGALATFFGGDARHLLKKVANPPVNSLQQMD